MSKYTTKPKGATRFYQTAFGVIPRVKLIELETEAVAKGLLWVIQSAPMKPRITSQLLLDLHKHCFGFIFPDWAGTIRTVPVQVSTHTPPPPHAIREHLRNFERDLHMQLRSLPKEESDRRNHLISTAAWMQHRIVWIHPLLDYNGRIGRLITNLFFLEHGLPLVEIPAEKTGGIRRQYVAAMQAGDKGNLKPLEDLLRRALREGK